MPHLLPKDHGDGSHPPVFAQALEAVWQTTGDDKNLERMLPNALSYHDWFEHTRRSASFPGLLLARRWSDTGADNSKRWGHHGSGIYGTRLAETSWSMPIVTTDVNVFSVLEKRALARLLGLFGGSRSATLFEEANERESLLHKMLWDDRVGFYFDAAESTSTLIPVWSPGGFIPLVLPKVAGDRVQRLVEHLMDPAKFWLKAPIPTLSADDPDFRPDHSYWMGPTWMSYMTYILRGLLRQSPQTGWALFDRMLDYLVVEGQPRIFENYNPITGQGQDCPDFGWHGMLADVFLIDLLGLQLERSREFAPTAGFCRAPVSWGTWSVENLRIRGRTYDVKGRFIKGAWTVDVNER